MSSQELFIMWLVSTCAGFMFGYLRGLIHSHKEDTNPEPKLSDFSDIEDWSFAYRFWEKTRKK
jgi:hypothetical protein